MASKTADGVTYGALGLAVATALIVAFYSAGDAHQSLQRPLFTSAAPEVPAAVGAIGESPLFAVPP
jgi:hypothetical protein